MLSNKGLYKTSIGNIRLRLLELQETNFKVQELKMKNGYHDIDRVLHYQGLLFMLKAILIKLISRHHNDPLAGHFEINKI